MPPALNQQSGIVEMLDAIERKIDLHRRKRDVLEELFKVLPRKLMTGDIRAEDMGSIIWSRVTPFLW